MYLITCQRQYTLHVDIRDWDGASAYAEYNLFYLEDEAHKYSQMLHGYSGSAGDSLMAHNGRSFTAIDKDNDLHAQNCAELCQGSGWWYRECVQANLNGFYLDAPYRTECLGVEWRSWKKGSHSLAYAAMRVKPTFTDALD